MSTLQVKVCRARNVRSHSNADSLDFVTVANWDCIVKRGSVVEGQIGVYFPIDSVLPQQLNDYVFQGAKVKPHGGRVRTAKIRGQVSQGLFLPLHQLPLEIATGGWSEGDDVADALGITKYEPPETGANLSPQQQKKSTRKRRNPHFPEYHDIEHLKWYPEAFKFGEPVAVTEKIHGSNGRAGWAPRVPFTWWEKLLAKLRLLPKHEFVYGSRRVQLQYSGHKTTSYYGDDIWSQVVRNYKLREKLKPGELVYGEVYGPGIQKNYSYGVPAGQREFAVFDVQVDGRWLDHFELVRWCIERQLPMVPTLLAGPFVPEVIARLTDGPSVLHPETKVREGIVVRPIFERNRLVLKSVSAAFLLDESNTDFH